MQVRECLLALPQKKWVFTNCNEKHAHLALQTLQIDVSLCVCFCISELDASPMYWRLLYAFTEELSMPCTDQLPSCSVMAHDEELSYALSAAWFGLQAIYINSWG